MANWRATSALFITGFLIVGLFSALTAAPWRATGASLSEGQILTSDYEVTILSHKTTYEEMLTSKQIIGVREPGRNYNIIIDGHGTGLAPPTEEEWNSMVASYDMVDRVTSNELMMSSLDLSSYPTFPKVGNQAMQGSCAAWSATYYTYGYMESDDNGWTDAKTGNPEHLLSAAWTYNKVNGGHDAGSWMSSNMEISVDWGTATLATMPYNDRDPVSWGSMEAFREAPLHRASQVHGLSYMGQSTVDSAKTLLQSGHPIAYAMNADAFGPSFADGNYIMSALEYNVPGLNHAQTIVGFDDSITDDGEVGAFKIVNSWGSGWANGGYYWMTYDAFKELGSRGVLSATYVDDIIDYVPSMLSVWHFNAAPTRSASLSVGIGWQSNPVKTKSPYWEIETLNKFPTFMALDITEFQGTYDSGTTNFFLSVGVSASNGVISDFKVELYEGGYFPGTPTQASRQSPGIPKNTPGYVTNTLPYYSEIPQGVAMDYPSLVLDSSSYVKWVAVPEPLSMGGTILQSGDVGDLKSSGIQTTLNGPLDFWFDWMISSEMTNDTLSFSIDGTLQAAISGDLSWQTGHYFIDTGPHTLKWEYTKDSVTSVGCDCAWIDNFMVDVMPPLTSSSMVGTRGASEWFRSSVVVTLTATDGIGSGVESTHYRFDGGIWQAYNVPFTVSGEGTHTIEYYSIDFAGNMEDINQETAKIDITPPTTSAVLSGTLGSASWYTTEVAITLQATDAWSGVNWTRYRLDSGQWQFGASILLSDDGLHVLEYQSQDNADNMESIGTVSVNIDKERPLTNLTLTGTVGGDSWYTTQVGVSLASRDSTSGIDFIGYRTDGGNWLFYSGFFTINADGVHVIEYYSQDRSGNKEDTKNVTVKVDQTAPLLTLNQADGEIYSTSSITMSWSSVDATSGLARIETVLDGGSLAVHDVSTMSLLLSNLDEGAHEFLVRAFDEAGLMNEKLVQFVVDTLPPVSAAIAIGSTGLNEWFISTITVSIGASDATTGVKNTQFRIGSSQWQPYLGPFTILSEGIHAVEYQSIDNAGNTEVAKQIEVKLDIFAPTTSYSLDATMGLNGWYVTYVKVTLSASDVASGVAWSKFRVDNGDWLDHIGPFLLATDGMHTVEFYSQDLSGHVENIRSAQIKVDHTAPALAITSPDSEVWGNDVSISWEGGDAASGLDRFEISIDGGQYQEMRMTNTMRNLPEGAHTISIKAVDMAGNVNEKRLNFIVNIETVGGFGDIIKDTPSNPYLLLGALIVVMTALIVGMGLRRRRRPDDAKGTPVNRRAPDERAAMRPPPPDDMPPPPMD